MTRHVLHIVSGIPPDSSGTGRLLTHILSQKAAAAAEWDIRFYHPLRSKGSRRQMIRERRYIAAIYDLLRVAMSWFVLRIKLRLLIPTADSAILIFHPQTLGFERALQLLKRWRGRAFLFGLDNSFFCIRSYNYVPGEEQSCLRCLGGRFEDARELRCTPFPVPDPAANNFVRVLFDLLRKEEVIVLAQNQRNADLYRRHVGDKVQVHVVGLWTADWTTMFESPASNAGNHGFDVVYHGYFVPAKGADWMLEVARRLSDVRFLFPTPLPLRISGAPGNITFKPMTWESGLDKETARARIVCVPSLWSATIEGALIKSIMFGRAAARVDVPSAYGDELPDGLILNLDPDPEVAAQQLGKALESDWTPDPVICEAWIRQFRKENIDLLGNMLRVIKRHIKRKLNAALSSGNNSSVPAPIADHGLKLQKLGTSYGGWTIPVEHIDKDWICYCIGAGEDISFDCELIESFGCNVFVFDPTPRAIEHIAELRRRVESGTDMPINNNPEACYTLPREMLNKLHFYPYGVWSENTIQKFYTPKNSAHVSHSILNLQHTKDYFEADCRTLPTLMEEFGHDRIDLLKLDVEGAEYEILKSLLQNDIVPRVLCVEFDEGNLPLDSGASQRIRGMVEQLQAAGFTFVNKDGWNMIFVHENELVEG